MNTFPKGKSRFEPRDTLVACASTPSCLDLCFGKRISDGAPFNYYMATAAPGRTGVIKDGAEN
jgi:hypothetical protein